MLVIFNYVCDVGIGVVVESKIVDFLKLEKGERGVVLNLQPDNFLTFSVVSIKFI